MTSSATTVFYKSRSFSCYHTLQFFSGAISWLFTLLVSFFATTVFSTGVWATDIVSSCTTFLEADELFEILLYLPSILNAIEHAKNLIMINTVVIRSLTVEKREKIWEYSDSFNCFTWYTSGFGIFWFCMVSWNFHQQISWFSWTLTVLIVSFDMFLILKHMETLKITHKRHLRGNLGKMS